jgi:DNA-directed RNA polymerase specialized sigma24 family protein
VRTEESSSEVRAHVGIFATTHWSVVLAAGRADTPQATAALEELCRTYWYPVYAYIRRQVDSPEAAEDYTQEFFARLLAKDYLCAVQSQRGRFRWFLLCAVKRFLINEHEHARAAKRGGKHEHLPFDGAIAEGRYGLEIASDTTPDKLFDRAWAMTLLTRVHRLLEEEYALEAKAELFERLHVFLSGDGAEVTYAQTGAELRMTDGAVRVAVHRLRRRFRELLRAEVAQTTRTRAELEEELRELRAIFAG